MSKFLSWVRTVPTRSYMHTIKWDKLSPVFLVFTVNYIWVISVIFSWGRFSWLNLPCHSLISLHLLVTQAEGLRLTNGGKESPDHLRGLPKITLVISHGRRKGTLCSWFLAHSSISLIMLLCHDDLHVFQENRKLIKGMVLKTFKIFLKSGTM